MLQQKKDVSIYLFSAELSNKTKAENIERTKHLEEFLRSWTIPYTKVIGSYKGQTEVSFRVQAKFMHPKFINDIIFNRFSQESILRVNRTKSGFLVFSDGNKEILGKLKSTSIKQAINKLEAFTIYGNKAWYFSNE